jgi:hypothetical protein
MFAPGGVSYGAIDDRGNPLIKQLFENPDISAGASHLAEVRSVIKRAFFEDLYIIRQELKSHVSASEQLLRDQQRGILLAPLKRQETEWFTPQTERELDLMAEMGMLDDMPPEVAEAGGLYQLIYDNPLATARMAGEASAFYTMLQGVSPIMQLNPEQTVPQFFREYPFERTVERAWQDPRRSGELRRDRRGKAGRRRQRPGACRQGEPARSGRRGLEDRQEFRAGGRGGAHARRRGGGVGGSGRRHCPPLEGVKASTSVASCGAFASGC